MIEPINSYVALLDACVLVPMPLCHTLLNLAEEPALYIPKWSEEILSEVARTLRRLTRTEHQIDRRLHAMRTAFEDALVSGYEDLVPVMKNHPKDRHVIAAAIRGNANVTVSCNTKHFPEEALSNYGMLVSTPDEFLCHQFHLQQGIAVEAIERQAADINTSAAVTLDRLAASAPEFVKLIRKARNM